MLIYWTETLIPKKKKRTQKFLLVANKKADLEGSTEKNKLIFVSRVQNVGQIHNIKIAQLKTWHTSDTQARL